MEINIKESSIGKFYRIAIKSIIIYSIFFSFIVLLMSLKGDNFVFALALFVSLVYLSTVNRVARILKITDDAIILQTGKKIETLQTSKITYMFKTVDYPLTGNYGIIIGINKGYSVTRRRYLVINNPENDLMRIFQKMGIG